MFLGGIGVYKSCLYEVCQRNDLALLETSLSLQWVWVSWLTTCLYDSLLIRYYNGMEQVLI